jgi:predicted membrane channel-forming protein YqfA (hemolysin III family)
MEVNQKLHIMNSNDDILKNMRKALLFSNVFLVVFAILAILIFPDKKDELKPFFFLLAGIISVLSIVPLTSGTTIFLKSIFILALSVISAFFFYEAITVIVEQKLSLLTVFFYKVLLGLI